MDFDDELRVESETLSDFARVMHPAIPSDRNDAFGRQPGRLHLDQDNLKNGLGQLVLKLVKLLHELLEHHVDRLVGLQRNAFLARTGLAEMALDRFAVRTDVGQMNGCVRLFTALAQSHVSASVRCSPLGQSTSLFHALLIVKQGPASALPISAWVSSPPSSSPW